MSAKTVEPRVKGAKGAGARRERGARRRAARKVARAERSWLREVKGLVALGVAAIVFAALYLFDPGQPSPRSSPVGAVGLWLGWAVFSSVGYAGYLVPLLLVLYGVGAFARARWGRGWPGLVGLGVLLVGMTGAFARLSESGGAPVQKGGLLGWVVAEALGRSLGTIGGWIVLGLALPVGLLLVTRGSIGTTSRGLGA